jgi:hypothetical protein
MQNVNWVLTPGLYAGFIDDFCVHVVEPDRLRPGVFYIGRYPYDENANRLHPDAPHVAEVWDRQSPGARQISERQKRIAHLSAVTLVEPEFELRHA